MTQELLPALTADLSPLQQGWLRMASIRQQLFTDLQNAELSVQGILSGLEGNTHLGDIQASIKTAKSTMAEAKEKRLAFSRMISEKLLDPAMEYEKRMAALIDTAGKHELELRKAEAEEAQKKQAHAAEVAALKAHIVNENYRIAAEFRAKMEQETIATYTNCLKAKVPIAGIESVKSTLVKTLNEFKPESPSKYQRKLVTDSEALDIFNSMPNSRYNPSQDKEDAINMVNGIFLNYENDLANSDAAAKAMEKESEQKQSEQAQLLAAEQATNVLIAQAETAVIDAPTIKKELRIVTIETEAWAMAVVANFIKNWQYCNRYVRVKSWSKLTINQMADALAKHSSESGQSYSGLQFEEICK